MDVIKGLAEPALITGEKALQVVLPPRSSVHDFDLGFQLKYLKKLGKLGNVSIIGLPAKVDGGDYSALCRILDEAWQLT